MTDKIEAQQFRLFIVRPTLERLAPVVPYSAAAENIVVGTALYETGLTRFDQWTGKDDDTLGPALGVYQIERPTHADLYANFIERRGELLGKIMGLTAQWPAQDVQLVTNLAYATAICRLIYFRRPEPLPAADDIDGMGAFYKAHYNTPAGAGTAQAWAECYRRYAA